MMQTTYNTSFTVMPNDCNYLVDMLCGGILLYHMDIAAAMAARRALYNTECRNALTVGATDIKFIVGATVGDLIKLEATVVSVGIKSLTIKVVGHRENREDGSNEEICEATFVFCAIDSNRKSAKHGLKLKEN